MPTPPATWFERDPLELAPLLLGGVLRRADAAGTVALRLTEVEAYRGADDPGAHTFRGKTARNATMFG
ncbi:MAG: DNA-3-methyladenine glycosylase, partial [Agrococcus sp.]